MNKVDLQNEIASLYEQRNMLVRARSEAEAKNSGANGNNANEVRKNGVSNSTVSLSERAFAEFSKIGVPDQRFEEWKYAAPKLFKAASAQGALSAELVIKNAMVLTVEDGEFIIEESSNPNMLSGVTVHLISDDNFETDPSVAIAFESILEKKNLPFASLQTAIEEYTIAIHVTGEIEVPIHIRYITNSLGALLISTPTVLLFAAPNSKVTLVEEHVSHQPGNTIVTSLTSVVAQSGSQVNYIKVDHGTGQKSIAHTTADVFSNATFNAYTACLQGGFVRNDLHVRLLEPSADVHMYGVSVLDAEDLADNHTVVDHVAPHCTSRELYKGLYGGKSVGVFNGKIYVRPDAQKTLAYQANHTLLLSDSAQINTKPQLEIWADDVKCSHGATTGQLDEDALFYLRSRGIGMQAAKQLLTNAFVGEVVDRLPVTEVREFVQQHINNTLHVTEIEA